MTLTNDIQDAAEAGRAVPGKRLTFRVGSETWGIEVLRVQEIVALLPIAAVPHVPEAVRGVANLRGRVIPIVDLRTSFGLPAEDTEITCIVVVEVFVAGRETVLGIVVDEVADVIDIAEDAIRESPTLGDVSRSDALTGVAVLGERMVLLLDIDRALASSAVAVEASQADGR